MAACEAWIDIQEWQAGKGRTGPCRQQELPPNSTPGASTADKLLHGGRRTNSTGPAPPVPPHRKNPLQFGPKLVISPLARSLHRSFLQKFRPPNRTSRRRRSGSNRLQARAKLRQIQNWNVSCTENSLLGLRMGCLKSCFPSGQKINVNRVCPRGHGSQLLLNLKALNGVVRQ
uniref:Uncharacterized protein n=1 Tax=Spironucleus salmonicida TaxID=348837 RepID=V6LWM0_9EUKA|eukprot:EST49037.1 Hypothetical protein SS50377_10735 [Spironucleus salmonicida]